MLTLLFKGIRPACFQAIRLQHAHTREVLLNKAAQSALLRLDGFASLVDDLADIVDEYTHDRKGGQNIQGQFQVQLDHGNDTEYGQYDQIDRIHDGRTEIHPDLADILRDPIHKISRVIAFIEAHAQTLVLGIDLILQIVFDESGHDDDSLSGEEQKDPFDQCQYHV